MTDGQKVPVRTCVSCRISSDKKSLLRIVRNPEGEVKIDLTGKAPGRGAYLCGSRRCMESALKAKKISRALRCEIPESLGTELEKYVVDDNVGNSSNGNEAKQ